VDIYGERIAFATSPIEDKNVEVLEPVLSAKADYDCFIIADFKTDNWVHIGVHENTSKYDRIATIKITDGIQARIGFFTKNGKKTSEIVNYLFDTSKYDIKGAKEWVKKHEHKTISGSVIEYFAVAKLMQYEDGMALVMPGNEVYLTQNITHVQENVMLTLANKGLFSKDAQSASLHDLDDEQLQKLIDSSEDDKNDNIS
jgi:transcriptional regulator